MKKLLSILVSMALLFILTACGGGITSGEVVSKEYTPAHTQNSIIPIVISNGKTCSTIMVPYTYHYSDKWEITIRQYSEEENEFLTATYRVTEEVYNATEIGAQFEYVEDMEPSEPEYTREEQ